MTRKVKPPKNIGARFRRDVRFLREMLPPLLPVRVYHRRIDDCMGYTKLRYDPKGRPIGFIIAVDTALSWDATWQVMIHEWAHALAWHEGHETVDDHGPEWALALSRVYQETVEP